MIKIKISIRNLNRKWFIICIFISVVSLYFIIDAALYANNTHYFLDEENKYPLIDGFYYFESTNFSSVMNKEFDNEGIVLVNYNGDVGKVYNPVSISQHIIGLVPYLNDNIYANESFYKNLDFLLAYGELTCENNLVFPYFFDWHHNNETAPWYSSMAQGQAASAFLWGYRFSGERKYLEGAKKSIFSLFEENSSKGFMKMKNNGVWFKEYPNYDFEVLDGSLATIAGIYDLYKALDDVDPERKIVGDKLNLSLISFKNSSHEFESILFGHYYDNKKTIVNPGYYSTNLRWLDYLSNYDESLNEIRNDYIMEDCGFFKKMIMRFWMRLSGFYYYKILPYSKLFADSYLK
ncbi:MAG: hypothetical protein GX268_10980 [Methanomicrobiales archaeon]|nr:hypothetical protein [Methanomicrobiales archaeon]